MACLSFYNGKPLIPFRSIHSAAGSFNTTVFVQSGHRLQKTEKLRFFHHHSANIKDSFSFIGISIIGIWHINYWHLAFIGIWHINDETQVILWHDRPTKIEWHDR